MCGILGLVSKNISDTDYYKFSSSLNKISRRGPDFSDIKKTILDQYQILFGHNRLSIMDLSKNGNQPMLSSSKKSQITFNGEIYNHLDLRNKFLKDFKWKSTSDTETLLELSERLSFENIMNLIRGMYSFALLKNSKLFLARDILGEKPLYYAFRKDYFIFSSEIEPIKHYIGKNNLDIDKFSLNQLTKLSYIPSPYTIFHKIFKLSPASYLEIDLLKPLEIYKNIKPKKFEKKYYSFSKTSNPAKTFDYQYYKKGTIDLIENSVNRQTLSDVPIGCFLSGGIDSSLIASILAKFKGGNKINTFTIGFDFAKFDEAPYAKKIANHLGTNHNELILNKKNITDELIKIPGAYSEPFADSSQLPTMLLSKMTSEHVKVALSGDGGDETHAGYDRYLFAVKYWPLMKIFPEQIRKTIFKFINIIPKKLIGFFLINIANINISGPTEYKIEKIVNKISKISNELSFYESLTNEWFDKDIVIGEKNFSIINKEQFLDESKHSFVDAMMLADLRTYLSDDILCKVDRASMFYSLETRAPYLDKDFVNFSLNIPSKYKIDKSNSKKILKDILKSYLPRNYFDRPKQGFGIPLYKWIREDLIEFGEELLSSSILKKHNYFDNSSILKAWDDHKNLRENNFNKLWPIMQFNLWYNSNFN